MRLLSLARDLRRRKARRRDALFVAEGIRAVEELLSARAGAGLRVRGALASPALDAGERGMALRRALLDAGVPVLEVSDADFASAADTDTPQGVLAIAEQPAHAVDAIVAAARGRPLLLLDAIQDPGNAGTMLRAAAALGAAGVLAMPGTVDLWSAKVVRGAMGAIYQLPVAHVAWTELDAARDDLPLWGADAAGAPIARAASDRPDRLGLVVGNEGNGLSVEARSRVDRLVAVPIVPAVESLNAAVAAGILLYELRPAALRS